LKTLGALGQLRKPKRFLTLRQTVQIDFQAGHPALAGFGSRAAFEGV
jgi:hypothetical protein